MSIIDTHSHFYPDWYLTLLKARTEIPKVVEDAEGVRFVMFPGEYGRPMDAEYWDLDRKLAFMDRFDISQTFLSLGNPWLDPFEGTRGIEITRHANQYFSELERETEGRILGMGVLPPDDVEAAAGTAREIAGTAGLYGVITGTRVCGKPIDDPDLEPLWQALEDTRLPVLIHPHHTSAGDELTGYGHAFPVAMGFTFETTIAIARLVFAGVILRHPQLNIVASHGGGTIPFLAGRLDSAWRSDPSVQARLPHPPTEDLRRISYDAVLFHTGALLATADLAGTERMPWGTDHPFSVADPSSSLTAVRATFEAQAQEEVLAGSARRIFLEKWKERQMS
ncbi:MAG: amidohydrolase [Actinobacteria bacterium]|nr:amidohydrolase [Actinomycetota bacterium]